MKIMLTAFPWSHLEDEGSRNWHDRMSFMVVDNWIQDFDDDFWTYFENHVLTSNDEEEVMTFFRQCVNMARNWILTLSEDNCIFPSVQGAEREKQRVSTFAVEEDGKSEISLFIECYPMFMQQMDCLLYRWQKMHDTTYDHHITQKIQKVIRPFTSLTSKSFEIFFYPEIDKSVMVHLIASYLWSTISNFEKMSTLHNRQSALLMDGFLSQFFTTPKTQLTFFAATLMEKYKHDSFSVLLIMLQKMFALLVLELSSFGTSEDLYGREDILIFPYKTLSVGHLRTVENLCFHGSPSDHAGLILVRLDGLFQLVQILLDSFPLTNYLQQFFLDFQNEISETNAHAVFAFAPKPAAPLVTTAVSYEKDVENYSPLLDEK